MFLNNLKLLRWTAYISFFLLFIVGITGALLTTTINLDYGLLKTIHLISALAFIGVVGVHGLLGLKRIFKNIFYVAAIFFIFYVILLYIVVTGIPF